MRAIFILVFLFSSIALGRGNPPRALAANTLSDGNWSGTNSMYLKITPYAQGVGFGANYEKVLSNNFGVGGGITILPEKEDTTTPALSAPGLLAVGGNVYLHFPIDVVDFYVAPGINMMMMEFGSQDKTTIGASMAIGTLAQVNKSFAAGLEITAIQPWFNKEFYLAGRSYFFNSSLVGRFTF
ncbi:MAG: outer membrane beta-barrel protein [Bdellovibrionaceae bacterium]|nr:outer membrane beta-barrel protein [Pseudobdellovibrionaceae bacterium]